MLGLGYGAVCLLGAVCSVLVHARARIWCSLFRFSCMLGLNYGAVCSLSAVCFGSGVC